MTQTFQAIYENGVFRPTEPVSLPDHAHVTLSAEIVAQDEEDYSDVWDALRPGFTGMPDLAERHNEHQP